MGFAELKLYEGNGNLEIWFTDFGMPLDFPASTKIEVIFTTPQAKTINLVVRNLDKNEDEDGRPNIRGDNIYRKTNYFAFPGVQANPDPSWRMGRKFRGCVKIKFTIETVVYSCEPFFLTPTYE